MQDIGGSRRQLLVAARWLGCFLACVVPGLLLCVDVVMGDLHENDSQTQPARQASGLLARKG